MILAMKFEKSMAFLRRIRLNFSLFMTLTPFPDCPGTSPGAIRKGSQGHEQGEIQPDSPQERHALFILHRQYHWCVCCPFSDLWTRLPDTTRVRTPRPPHQPHFRPSLLHPSHSGKHIVRKTHSTLPEQPILQGVRRGTGGHRGTSTLVERALLTDRPGLCPLAHGRDPVRCDLLVIRCRTNNHPACISQELLHRLYHYHPRILLSLIRPSEETRVK